MRSRRINRPDHTWPGFVDGLTTLLMTMIFIMVVFLLAQFILTRQISGKDAALARLTAEIENLSVLLNLEKSENLRLSSLVGQLQASLSGTQGDVEGLKSQLQKAIDERNALDLALAELRTKQAEVVSALETKEKDLGAEKEISAEAQRQLELLNRQLLELRAQMASIQEVLEAEEKKAKEQEAIIADLGKRLNVALAQKVSDLIKYRSEFFGRLREVLGNVDGIQIVGDRFVFQSEVLFASGSADIGEAGKQQMLKLAETLKQVSAKFPEDIDWILRIDGHTDRNPIATDKFPSNWELSTARAISVVQFLAANGIPSKRLAATGFAEFQPLDLSENPKAFAKNRRIELKLDQR